MRPKTFTAATMTEAMAEVRARMGEDAVILSTVSLEDGSGVLVTAAIEWPDAEPALPDDRIADDLDAGEASEEVRQALVHHGTPPPLAERLAKVAAAFAADGPLMALAGAFDAEFGFSPFADQVRSRPLMMVGPPGAGKTLSVAKLATRQRRLGRKVSVATIDTRRAGGVEQLEAFTRILGIELVTADAPETLAAALENPDGPVYIDSFGINPFDEGELAQLGAFIQRAAADPVLVLAAGCDVVDATDTARAFAALGARRLLATRVDLARRLGGLLAAAHASRLAFSEVGVGGRVAGDLAPINPVSLARLVLPDAADANEQPAYIEAAG